MTINHRSFGLRVLLGMAAGLLLGFVARAIGPGAAGEANALALGLKAVGGSFVALLSATVPPLIFAAIVTSVGNLRRLDNAARLGGQTLLWFAITALISVSVAIAVGMLLPSMHIGVIRAAPGHVPGTVGNWLDFLKGIMPGNALGLAASTRIESGVASTRLSFNTLQVVVVSLAVGFATLQTGDKGEPFLGIVASFLAVMRRILSWIIQLTPIGSAALIGTAVATYGWAMLAQLSGFAVAMYLGLAIVLMVVYPSLLALNGISPARFFGIAWPAIQLGFVSRSSVGTLPVTELVTERMGVDKAYAAFAVPLASTTKMDGCASVYPALAAIFVANFYGLPLHLGDYMLIVLVSVLGSAATAGMTGAIVMLTLTLSTLGLPLEGAGLLLAIDPIIDMGRTAVNVAGQVLVTTIVAKREGILEVQERDGFAVQFSRE